MKSELEAIVHKDPRQRRQNRSPWTPSASHLALSPKSFLALISHEWQPEARSIALPVVGTSMWDLVLTIA